MYCTTNYESCHYSVYQYSSLVPIYVVFLYEWTIRRKFQLYENKEGNWYHCYKLWLQTWWRNKTNCCFVLFMFFIFTFLHISTLYITTGVLDYSHKVRLSFNIIIHLVDNTLKLHCKKTYSTHRIMRNKGVMVALKRSPGATE